VGLKTVRDVVMKMVSASWAQALFVAAQAVFFVDLVPLIHNVCRSPAALVGGCANKFTPTTIVVVTITITHKNRGEGH
jgi:hypothetical protein